MGLMQHILKIKLYLIKKRFPCIIVNILKDSHIIKSSKLPQRLAKTMKFKIMVTNYNICTLMT